MSEVDYDKLHAWLQVGLENKWISPPFCFTHDGDMYMTDEEQQEWEDGGDPCCSVIKVLV
jgi:hypothetical protein